MDCSLCNPALGPIIREGTYWRLVLNHNQNLLGKCFLATRRHIEEVPRLTGDEWLELHRQIGSATEALVRAFAPDHFNYVFLQNQDRHVHLHIIPRYAESRTFGGHVFDDPGFPGHYTIDDPPRRLSQDEALAVAEAIGKYIRLVEGAAP